MGGWSDETYPLIGNESWGLPKRGYTVEDAGKLASTEKPMDSPVQNIGQ
jgi:hypothetical protein